jgi:hypothetical protein
MSEEATSSSYVPCSSCLLLVLWIMFALCGSIVGCVEVVVVVVVVVVDLFCERHDCSGVKPNRIRTHASRAENFEIPVLQRMCSNLRSEAFLKNGIQNPYTSIKIN